MQEPLQTLALAVLEQERLTSFHATVLDLCSTCEDYVKAVFKDAGLAAQADMNLSYNIPGTLRFTTLPEQDAQPRMKFVLDCIRPEEMPPEEFGHRYKEALSTALIGLVQSQNRLSFPYAEKEIHLLTPKHLYTEYRAIFRLHLSA